MFRRTGTPQYFRGSFLRANSTSQSVHRTAQAPSEAPRLRQNLFSNTDGQVDWRKIPTDTFPNPLFAMSTEEIKRLRVLEYKHLVRLPYKWIEETGSFCNSMMEIINDLLLSDPAMAVQYYKSITDSDLRAIMEEKLRKAVADPIKASIMEMMLDANGDRFQKSFIQALAVILKLPGKDQADTVISYLGKLSKLDLTVRNPLVVSSRSFETLLHNMPREKYPELYAYFVHLNIQTYVVTHVDKLKHELLAGSTLEKLVAKTGLLKPKWHHTRKPIQSSKHLDRMRNFFTIRDLSLFATYAIEKKDIVNANLYVSLLVTKFEQKCKDVMEENYRLRLKDSDINSDILMLLKALLRHVMVFKGSHECIRMLQYMVSNNLTVTFDVLMIITDNLLKQGYFQEALLLLNNIRPDKLSRLECLALSSRILSLIRAKYPTSPKIIFGYVAAMFQDGVLVLNKLRLLGLVYQDGVPEALDRPEELVQRANIDPKLTAFDFTPKALSQVYETCLLALPRSTLTPQVLAELYQGYVSATETCDNRIFKENSRNDDIIILLTKYLLKENPESSDMSMLASENAYNVAKDIVTDYIGRLKTLLRRKRNPYFFDIVITSALSQHKDHSFATQMIRESRSLNLPFTFNQIYPFVIYHYEKKEYKQAELWYQQLFQHGVKADSEPAKSLFRIARELNWKVSGFVYRQQGIKRNYQKKEELRKLINDPIMLIDPEVDPVDAEWSEKHNSEANHTNFGDRLLSFLH